MSIYDCNAEWPVCIFDFTFRNRNPNFFVFKVARSLYEYVRPNYFGEEKDDDYD